MPYKANSYSSNPPDRFLQQMKIVSTTGSEILAVSDVKEFTRIDTSSDDSIILRNKPVKNCCRELYWE